MYNKVLGIDLGTSMATTGAVTLEIGDQGVYAKTVQLRVDTANPRALAAAIDAFVATEGIAALSLDGPQGWRDPALLASGKYRQCEREVRAPFKTGIYGTTFPATCLEWIFFTTDVFSSLIAHGGGQLANELSLSKLKATASRKYWILESFPTSTWRTAGLTPLPAKRKCPSEVLTECAEKLARRFGLASLPPLDHDQLQAVVAALPAVALMSDACDAVPRGLPASTLDGHALEGLIWDARPSTELSGS